MAKSKFTRWQSGIVAGVLVLISGWFGVCQAATPLEVVRDSNQAILAVYNSSAPGQKAELTRIFAIMDAVTDYNSIAGMAVKEVCGTNQAAVCSTIRKEFITMLRLSATTKLGRYRADRFEYLNEDIVGDRATVRTVAHFKDESVKLDYVLEQSGGNWRIVNYLVDDIDTVRNYQRQFKKIVAKEKLQGLLFRLQKKNREYRDAG